MNRVSGFSSLEVGQWLKVKGKPSTGGRIEAVEIKTRMPRDESVVEGVLERIDHKEGTLQVMQHTFAVADGVMVKSADSDVVTLAELKAGDMVKMKGTFAGSKGLSLEKIKIKGGTGFSVGELQGGIEAVDPVTKTFTMVGFTVVVNDKTKMEGY